MDLIKIDRQREFMLKHTLTPEQRQNLLAEKLARAMQYTQAKNKRKDAVRG